MYNIRDMQRSRIFRVLVGFLLLSVLGAGCTKGPDAATIAASKPVTLNVWGVNDDEDVYDPSCGLPAFACERDHQLPPF